MFFAKIPRHTRQNAITEGDLECILTRNCEGTEQLLLFYIFCVFIYTGNSGCFVRYPIPECWLPRKAPPQILQVQASVLLEGHLFDSVHQEESEYLQKKYCHIPEGS